MQKTVHIWNEMDTAQGRVFGQPLA